MSMSMVKNNHNNINKFLHHYDYDSLMLKIIWLGTSIIHSDSHTLTDSDTHSDTDSECDTVTDSDTNWVTSIIIKIMKININMKSTANRLPL